MAAKMAAIMENFKKYSLSYTFIANFEFKPMVSAL
jgi:hypothetical protein